MSGLRYVDTADGVVSGLIELGVPVPQLDLSWFPQWLAQDWAPKCWECRVVVVGEEIFVIAIQAGSARSLVDWRSDYPAIMDSLIRLLAQGSHR